MADDLRAPHRQLGADEAEMARYRARLADRLASSGAAWPWRTLWVAAAGLAAVGLIGRLLLPQPATALPQSELPELRQLADEATPTLISRARELAVRGQPPDRWNALMLLSLTQAPEEAVRHAARGLQQDGRPEFRRFYLELLLDQADEYRYNVGRIEELMDRESDRECLRLYRSLLRLAI